MSNSVMCCQNSTVKNDFVKSLEADGMAEWSARRTRNPAVPGSGCAFVLGRVQILGHSCKYPTGCLLLVGVFNPVMLCCI